MRSGKRVRRTARRACGARSGARGDTTRRPRCRALWSKTPSASSSNCARATNTSVARVYDRRFSGAGRGTRDHAARL